MPSRNIAAAKSTLADGSGKSRNTRQEQRELGEAGGDLPPAASDPIPVVSG
jgi:hypothetical protein